MKRTRIPFRPTKNDDLSYDDFYDDSTYDWRRKAEAVQVRRWRAMKHEIKGGR